MGTTNKREFKPSNSSQIKEYYYDEKKQELHLVFRNNKLYKYAPITAEEFKEFEEAESQGTYFHAKIKQRLVINTMMFKR